MRTIFSTAEECLRGERTGWEEFVREYSRFALPVLAHYFPALSPVEDHVRGVFERAHQDGNQFFQGLKFANEREFAFAFYNLVLAYGREADQRTLAQVSLGRIRETMKDLPWAEQQMFWLCLRGYSAEQISPILMNAEATARKVQQIATERVGAIVPDASPGALTLAARAIMMEAEAARTEQCLPLKTFNNIINGQITWRERDVAEKHVATCFYCLDRFTTFQEVVRVLKDRQAASEEEVERTLSQLGFAPRKKTGLLARMLASKK